MVEDTLLIDLEGILSDWDVYTFSLDITSPGKQVHLIYFLCNCLTGILEDCGPHQTP